MISITQVASQFQLKEVQKQQSKEIGQLKDTQERQGENIAALAAEISEVNKQQSENIAGMAAEMRGAFDNLIIANEVTRELSHAIFDAWGADSSSTPFSRCRSWDA